MNNAVKLALEIVWLTQGGFLLCAGNVRLVVDPYLSDALAARGLPRMVAAPVTLSSLRPTAICCTHDHADHFDEQTIQPLCAMYPECPVVGPQSIRAHYTRLGLNTANLRALDLGGEYCEGGLSIRAVKACHTDPHAIGLLIRLGGKSIYLSGDTTLEEGFAEQLAEQIGGRVDVMIVCINGKLGNMNAAQAASLAERLQPTTVIPMHYGLFADNTADPEPFAAEIRRRGMECLLPEPGRALRF